MQLAVRAAARSRSPSSPKLPSVRAPPTPSSRTRDPQHAAVDDDVDLQAGGASVLGGVRQCLGDDEVQAARGAAGDRPLGSKRGISGVVCSRSRPTRSSPAPRAGCGARGSRGRRWPRSISKRSWSERCPSTRPTSWRWYPHRYAVGPTDTPQGRRDPPRPCAGATRTRPPTPAASPSSPTSCRHRFLLSRTDRRTLLLAAVQRGVVRVADRHLRHGCLK